MSEVGVAGAFRKLIRLNDFTKRRTVVQAGALLDGAGAIPNPKLAVAMAALAKAVPNAATPIASLLVLGFALVPGPVLSCPLSVMKPGWLVSSFV